MFYKEPRKWIDVVAIAIGVGVGVVLPLASVGDGLGQAVPIVAVGASSAVIFGAAVFFLIPPRRAWPVFFFGFLAGMFVWSRLGGGWPVAIYPWVPLSIAGTIIGAQLRYLWDRRKSSSPPTPPPSSSGIGPDGRTDPA